MEQPELQQATSIAKELAKVVKIPFETLKAKSNVERITKARNVVYYVLHREFGVSLNQLCDIFGRTNREICYRISDADTKYEKDAAFRTRCASVIREYNERKNN